VFRLYSAIARCKAEFEINETNYTCTSSLECGNPPGVGLCNKTTGICECQLPTCFYYSNATNSCLLKKCRTLSIEDNARIVCMNRGAKSKTQALLLNIFAFTGAANIYLKHYAQGITQMIVLLALIIVILVRLYMCTCICNLRTDKRYDIVGNRNTI